MRRPPLCPRAIPWVTGLILLTHVITPAPVWAGDTPLPAAANTPPSAASDGLALWLGEGPSRFRAIYNDETIGRRSGAAIILPGAGAQADSIGVIEALRRRLPPYGWATLALDPPPAGAPPIKPDTMNTLNEQSAQRLRLAVTTLKQRGISNIVIIGHGLGAALGASYLTQSGDSGVAGFVGMGMGGPWEPGAGGDYSARLLEKVTLPVLDIYGGRDLEEVRLAAPGRAAAARRAGRMASQTQTITPFLRSGTAQTPVLHETGYISYRQVQIAGADHSYTHVEETLVKRVAGWLRRHTEGVELPRTTNAVATTSLPGTNQPSK